MVGASGAIAGVLGAYVIMFPTAKIMTLGERVEEEANRLWYTEVPEQRGGMLSPFPDRPGLGLALNPKTVERYAV